MTLYVVSYHIEVRCNFKRCSVGIGYRSYITITKELSGNERSRIKWPLNFYMIYDLLIVFSSFYITAPLQMVALTTSWIYLMIYLINITNIDKICD